MQLPIQFIFENLHFGVSLVIALVFFGAFWLYFDAWMVKKNARDFLKFLGFLLLSLSFVVHSTYIEESILPDQILGNGTVDFLTSLLRIQGYLALIIGIALDPLEPKPETHGIEPNINLNAAFLVGGGISMFLPVLQPFLALGVAFLYLRRATFGLEAHLKPISLAFFIFALAELISLSSLFRSTDNVAFSYITSQFGIAWILEHLIFLTAAFFLGRWVFKYLLKRLQTQLFMISTNAILIIFILTTVTFTSLLLRNLEKDVLAQLQTDVNVLEYAIEGKQAETLSDAQVIAQNSQLQKAVMVKDKTTLEALSTQTLLTKKQAFLIVLSDTGQVLMRGENPSRTGDSLSSDPLFKGALRGKNVSSVVTQEGVLSPEISVRSSTPIKFGNRVIGVVIVGTGIDDAFVDGVKNATGLESSVYAGNIRSATTFIAPDNKSRWVGIKEENPEVNKKVLGEGKSFSGGLSVLNVPYLAAFSPLKDSEGQIVGMLFVGKEQISVLKTAGNSIEITFLVASILLCLSIIPSFLVAKFLSNQLK